MSTKNVESSTEVLHKYIFNFMDYILSMYVSIYYLCTYYLLRITMYEYSIRQTNVIILRFRFFRWYNILYSVIAVNAWNVSIFEWCYSYSAYIFLCSKNEPKVVAQHILLYRKQDTKGHLNRPTSDFVISFQQNGEFWKTLNIFRNIIILIY